MAIDETQQGGIEADPAGEQVGRPNRLEDVFRKVSIEPAVVNGLPQAERAKSRLSETEQGGFTRLFQALSDRDGNSGVVSGASERATSARPRRVASEGEGPVNRQAAAPLSEVKAGEFTQMFQTLRSEDTPDTRTQARSAAPTTGEAGFTQLLRTLSDENEARHDSPQRYPAAPSQDVLLSPVRAESGPGEFTRVISGSMLREAQGRMVPGIVEPPREAASTPSVASNFAPNERLQASAATPTSRITGATVSSTGVGSGASFAEAELRVAANHTAGSPGGVGHAASGLPPTAPLVNPAVVLPTAPTLGKGEVVLIGWQRYVPFLLLANLFVTLVVLVAVILLLMRR